MAKASTPPFTAVISGCAYETATTALRVLEEGRSARGWVNSEMLATLDNFINVMLFNERIYVTGCVELDERSRFVPRDYRNEAGPVGRGRLDEAGIFLPITSGSGDYQEVSERISRVLAPLRIAETGLFSLRCRFPGQGRALHQEMALMDAYFIEYAIEQFGAARFKPVFPAEHLYLGLRSARHAVPQATHTLADLPGRRLRDLVQEKMAGLNAFVGQGAPMLPEVPPMFVSRIVNDGALGPQLVPALMEIRESSTMKRFREWLAKCSELSGGEDYAQREKAAKALQKLRDFAFGEDIGAADFGKSLLKFAKDVAKADPLSIVAEIAPYVMKYLAGVPLAGLRDFGKGNADPRKLQAFFDRNFGDRLNRNDINAISMFLQLPADLGQWQGVRAELSAEPGRVDGHAPPLSRPYRFEVTAPGMVGNAGQDFEELWKRGEKLTPELLKKIRDDDGKNGA